MFQLCFKRISERFRIGCMSEARDVRNGETCALSRPPLSCWTSPPQGKIDNFGGSRSSRNVEDWRKPLRAGRSPPLRGRCPAGQRVGAEAQPSPETSRHPAHPLLARRPATRDPPATADIERLQTVVQLVQRARADQRHRREGLGQHIGERDMDRALAEPLRQLDRAVAAAEILLRVPDPHQLLIVASCRARRDR